jgi:hypothetical protein
LNKRPNANPILLDDIDPTSKWVEETHLVEFDHDYDIDDLGWIDLSLDPPVGVGASVKPCIAQGSTSHATYVATSTTT